MKRWLAAALAALTAWIVTGAVTADPEPAGAQSTGIEIRRTQDAAFLPAQNRDDPLYILALGSDARPGVCMPVDRCLADSIQLIAVNTRKHAATILGFPRDAYVPIPGRGDGKINNALQDGGPELVVETVENLVGVDVDYYLLTSFDGLTSMVDAVGGINVEIEYPMHDPFSGTDFDPGIEHLDGVEALRFSRDRKSVPNGDFGRSLNQGRLIAAALAGLRRDVEEDPAQLFRWIVAGVENVDTDLSFTEIFDLMLTALSIRQGRVTNAVVPGGLGFAGEASIVTLGEAAEALFKDLRRDGLLKKTSSG